MSKQKRLTDEEKIQLCKLYETGNYSYTELSLVYSISVTAIAGLLKRRGYKAKSHSELQRKYTLNEDFFDVIGIEQAYFLGLLFADGHNNSERSSVNLSLQEDDVKILNKFSEALETNKPLQYVKINSSKTHKNHYRLVIASKKISKQLNELGMMNRKTFLLKYPNWLSDKLHSHFIRGFCDGNGWIGKKSICIVSTESFCFSLADIIKKELDVNSYIRPRYKERDNNIRQLEISGGRQVRKFLKWIYTDAYLYLERKFIKYKTLHLDTV